MAANEHIVSSDDACGHDSRQQQEFHIPFHNKHLQHTPEDSFTICHISREDFEPSGYSHNGHIQGESAFIGSFPLFRRDERMTIVESLPDTEPGRMAFVVVKDVDRFVFDYDDDSISPLLLMFDRYAADKSLDFSPDDALLARQFVMTRHKSPA